MSNINPNFFLIAMLLCLLACACIYVYIKVNEDANKKENIGTIVVDRSDEQTNIFLEIEHDDIDKWENGKEYSVRVEVRDYITHE